MTLKQNFWRDGGVQAKKTFHKGVWIFSRTTQYKIYLVNNIINAGLKEVLKKTA